MLTDTDWMMHAKATRSMASRSLRQGETEIARKLFQAATQINEQTLSFLPRLLVMLLTLIWAGPWLVRELMEYTQNLVHNIPLLIG